MLKVVPPSAFLYCADFHTLHTVKSTYLCNNFPVEVLPVPNSLVPAMGIASLCLEGFTL